MSIVNVNFTDRFVGKKVRIFLSNGYTKVGVLESYDDMVFNIVFDDGRSEILNRRIVDTVKLYGGGYHD